MRLATANVHHDLLRVVNANPFIRNCDLLCIQEVEASNGQLEGYLRKFCEVSEWKHFAFAAEPQGYPDPNREHGVAILSRFPIQSSRIHLLPSFARWGMVSTLPEHFWDPRFWRIRCEKRQRVALEVRVDMPQGELQIITTHLDTRLNVKQKLTQIEPIVEAVGNFRGSSIIAGDFNAPRCAWWGTIPVPFAADPMEALRYKLLPFDFTTHFTRVRTFSTLPVQLDNIFVRDCVVNCWGIYPMKNSNHRALVMEFSLW